MHVSVGHSDGTATGQQVDIPAHFNDPDLVGNILHSSERRSCPTRRARPKLRCSSKDFLNNQESWPAKILLFASEIGVSLHISRRVRWCLKTAASFEARFSNAELFGIELCDFGKNVKKLPASRHLRT